MLCDVSLGRQNIHLSMEMVSWHNRGIVRGVADAVEANRLPWRLSSDWTEVVHSAVRRSEAAGAIGSFTYPETREGWRGSRVPIVNVSAATEPEPTLVSILPDNLAVGREAGTYFLARGFTRFAYVCSGHRWYEEQRHQGFVDTVSGTGPVIRHTGGGTSLRAFLTGLPQATAVFAATDAVARTVLTELHEMGRHVPEEIAVLGVDNDAMQSAFSPVPLSSIDLRSELIGRLAAEAMAELLAGGSPPPLQRVRPAPVVERQSTNLVAVPDTQVARLLQRIRQRACEGVRVSEILEPQDGPRRTLESKFRRFLGRSIEDEIRRCRLEAARAKLLLTRQPMNVIAEDCGFANVYHFSRVFKSHFGHPPGHCRRPGNTPAADAPH